VSDYAYARPLAYVTAERGVHVQRAGLPHGEQDLRAYGAAYTLQASWLRALLHLLVVVSTNSVEGCLVRAGTGPKPGRLPSRNARRSKALLLMLLHCDVCCCSLLSI